MANTGHFYVLSADLAIKERDHVEQVRSATVRCHRCGSIREVGGQPTEAHRSGIELYCLSCGVRQFVSSARFECELLQLRACARIDWLA